MTDNPLDQFTDKQLAEELRNRCDTCLIAMHRHDRPESTGTTYWAFGRTLEVIGLATTVTQLLVLPPDIPSDDEVSNLDDVA